MCSPYVPGKKHLKQERTPKQLATIEDRSKVQHSTQGCGVFCCDVSAKVRVVCVDKVPLRSQSSTFQQPLSNRLQPCVFLAAPAQGRVPARKKPAARSVGKTCPLKKQVCEKLSEQTFNQLATKVPGLHSRGPGRGTSWRPALSAFGRSPWATLFLGLPHKTSRLLSRSWTCFWA